jgi:predicted short-subunit dehydrogenase-like oxidoreductase (DUF2520 family)
LIIGDGKMAHHLRHYFSLLGLGYATWSRKENSSADLLKMTPRDGPVLLAIRDGALEGFIQEFRESFAHCTLVHFSGALEIAGAFSAHPLMTFGPEFYTLELYRSIPFVLGSTKSLPELIPGLDNVFYNIDPAKKSYYHALCVVGGNYTTFLWSEFLKRMETDLGIAREHLIPYLSQSTENVSRFGEHALTGPLVRRDTATLKENMRALEGTPLLDLYRAFIHAFGPDIEEGL